MMTEELSRIVALLEQLLRDTSVIAEGYGVLIQRFDQMDARFDQMERKFDVWLDRLESKLDRPETRSARLETKVDALEGFAIDTQRRLGQIETHLGLNHSRPAATFPEASTGNPSDRTKKS